jgi:hypothetical protein
MLAQTVAACERVLGTDHASMRGGTASPALRSGFTKRNQRLRSGDARAALPALVAWIPSVLNDNCDTDLCSGRWRLLSPTVSSAGVADMQLARDLPGFPGDRDWAFLISPGYPAGRPPAPVRNPDRRPFDEVVHRGRW